MINVVLFSSQWDTGGQGYRIKEAFDRHQPDFYVRSVHTDESYFNYPSDISTARTEIVARLFEDADVIHMRNDLSGLKRLGHGQPVVLHHHGTRFREYHEVVSRQARAVGAVQIASTLDLTLLEPDVIWVPSPFNLSELAPLIPHVRKANDPIRIAHAPTNREVKSTSRIMDAIQNLVHNGYNIVFDLIERRPWSECLARKSKADIYVDQLKLGYGNNAIEAWGMGIPVVAGIQNPHAREAMMAHWGRLPFREANEIDLEGQLAELIVDAELRAHWADVGATHLRTYHDETYVSMLLADIYRNAVAGAAREERVI